MGVELACNVLTVAVVVTCLSMHGSAYVLPDDVVSPTLTRHHQHHSHPPQQQQQQQQPGKPSDEEAENLLRVSVRPEFVVMRRGRPVHINCTATSAAIDQPPYISFFWQILDDTSLPLSSSVPGVTVQPMSIHGLLAKHHGSAGGGGRPAAWSRRHRDDDDSHYAVVTDSGQVNAAATWLGLGWRFYNFMPRGASKFGCLAYTLGGRRTVRYFTVFKI